MRTPRFEKRDDQAIRFLHHVYGYSMQELADLFHCSTARIADNINNRLEDDMKWLGETPLAVACPFLLAVEEGIAQAA
jgi:hypothetical protein